MAFAMEVFIEILIFDYFLRNVRNEDNWFFFVAFFKCEYHRKNWFEHIFRGVLRACQLNPKQRWCFSSSRKKSVLNRQTSMNKIARKYDIALRFFLLLSSIFIAICVYGIISTYIEWHQQQRESSSNIQNSSQKTRKSTQEEVEEKKLIEIRLLSWLIQLLFALNVGISRRNIRCQNVYYKHFTYMDFMKNEHRKIK